jgi:hypothetical protein
LDIWLTSCIRCVKHLKALSILPAVFKGIQHQGEGAHVVMRDACAEVGAEDS